ncbi:MAG: hypothetical protein K0S47_3291 [Herbinix sp.]|nr:hypothetical protein [Herbinix sp.]
MAGNDYIHTAEILQAATPYLGSKTKTTMDLISKFLELMGCFQNLNRQPDLAACGFETEKLDIEALLSKIRPLCRNREREMVDRILNIFSTMRMFETYKTYMEMMKTMQESMAPSDNTEYSQNTPESDNYHNDNGDHSKYYSSDNNGNENESGSNGSTDNINSENNNSDNDDSDGNKTDHVNNGSQSNTNKGSMFGGGNSDMINMLKSFIPSEQMNTFENLSMLLNAASYDNNSKT